MGTREMTAKSSTSQSPSIGAGGDEATDAGLADVLALSSTAAQTDCGSRKAALQVASELILDEVVPVDPDTPIDARQLFDGLLARERLGSTAFGEGVAIPHCRMPEVSGIQAALLTLNEGVDFDAPDETGVDLLCVLIVGHDSGDAHLRLLSQLATVLSDADKRSALRAESTAEGLRGRLLEFVANGSGG